MFLYKAYTVKGRLLAKLAEIRSYGDAMKYFFSRRVVERWNELDQHVVDASSTH